jgi:hypothetical protein
MLRRNEVLQQQHHQQQQQHLNQQQQIHNNLPPSSAVNVDGRSFHDQNGRNRHLVNIDGVKNSTAENLTQTDQTQPSHIQSKTTLNANR